MSITISLHLNNPKLPKSKRQDLIDGPPLQILQRINHISHQNITFSNKIPIHANQRIIMQYTNIMFFGEHLEMII